MRAAPRYQRRSPPGSSAIRLLSSSGAVEPPFLKNALYLSRVALWVGCDGWTGAPSSCRCWGRRATCERSVAKRVLFHKSYVQVTFTELAESATPGGGNEKSMLCTIPYIVLLCESLLGKMFRAETKSSFHPP